MSAVPQRRPAGQFHSQPSGDPVAIRLRLIGQMEAWSLTSENVLPVGRKTRALLAILATASSRPVLRAKLAEMLWSRRPEEQARASLRQEIHRLLNALGPSVQQVLLINRDHLALRPGAAWVDVDEVMRATPSKPAALSLLDGDLLEDLDGVDPAFDAWLTGERERLRDKARSLAEAMLRDQTEPDMTILAARQLLGIDRTHEGAWRALMRAHALRGERGMAIQAFERCRTALSDLLDAEPSEETQRLIAEIRASGTARPAPPQPLLRPARTEPKPDPKPDMVTERRTDSPGPAQTVRTATRVGVLPLQLNGMPEHDSHLGAGLAEEITAGLSRCRWMFMVSSSTLARFTAQSRDEAALRRAFDIHYLLDGSVQRVPGRLRVSLRMLDLRGGNQVVWSRRFDRADSDLLSMQDDIAAEAVAQIDPELLVIESQRISARPGPDLTAQDAMLRAMPMIDRLQRPGFEQGGALLRQAIALDPDYAPAQARLAAWHLLQVAQGWSSDPEADAQQAGRLAERAIALDPQDARSFVIAGHIRAVLHRRLPEAIALHDRALALNPSLASGWALSGSVFGYIGDLSEAARRLQHYKKLAPLHPQSYIYDTAMCQTALIQGDHSRAAELGRSVNELNPAYVPGCKPYLSALGHLGHAGEAAAALTRLLTLEPDFTVQKFLSRTPYQLAEHREHFAHGLRAAGVPEI